MSGRSILLIGTYPPPFGGVPRHIVSLADYLGGRGWNVHVLSAGRSGVERRGRVTIHKLPLARKLPAIVRSWRGNQEFQRSGLGEILVRNPRRGFAYFAATAIGKQIVEQHGIDVISAYNLVYGAPIGAVLARTYNLPLAVSNLGEIYSDRAFFEEHRKVVEYIVATGKAFFSCSQHCADSYREIGLDPKAESIPYGIDIHNFDADTAENIARRNMGLPESVPMVLYLGRLVAEMGLDTVLDAIPSVFRDEPNVQFVLAGAPGDLQPVAERLAAEYAGRVHVRPNVPPGQLPDLLSATTVLLAPTRGSRACSSLASAEAMAAGRAVVASRVGGIPEIVQDGSTGTLVPPGDAGALARAVVDLLRDPARAAALGRAGRKRVEDYWDENKTNAAYEARFLALVEKRRVPNSSVSWR